MVCGHQKKSAPKCSFGVVGVQMGAVTKHLVNAKMDGAFWDCLLLSYWFKKEFYAAFMVRSSKSLLLGILGWQACCTIVSEKHTLKYVQWINVGEFWGMSPPR